MFSAETLKIFNISVSLILVAMLSVGSNISYSQALNTEKLDSVQILKSSSNSYSVVNGTAYIKPFFDTTYIISGSSSALNDSQDLINSTVINDFTSSPTIGYIMKSSNAINATNNSSSLLPSLPNPFVDIQSVTKTISQQLSGAIDSAINLDVYEVDVRCTFGNNLQQWGCEFYSLPT